jgi:hypothetical protein
MFSLESLKSITPGQALLLLACLASLALAPKYLGQSDSERVVTAAGYVLMFLTGRGGASGPAPAPLPPPPQPKTPPDLKLHQGGKDDEE